MLTVVFLAIVEAAIDCVVAMDLRNFVSGRQSERDPWWAVQSLPYSVAGVLLIILLAFGMAKQITGVLIGFVTVTNLSKVLDRRILPDRGKPANEASTEAKAGPETGRGSVEPAWRRHRRKAMQWRRR